MNGAITSSNKDDKKNKRPDRSEKLIERKQFDLTVVKAALRKYIHGDEDVVDRIVYAIKIRVANLSRRTVLRATRVGEGPFSRRTRRDNDSTR